MVAYDLRHIPGFAFFSRLLIHGSDLMPSVNTLLAKGSLEQIPFVCLNQSSLACNSAKTKLHDGH